jgi:ferric-dicitrate binding protein FerR (iron transport regulator)
MTIMEENYELAKWLAGEMTESEIKTFQETPEYASYNKIAYHTSQLKTPVFNENELYKNVVENKKSAPKVISFHKSKWLRIAALLVVFLSLTFVLKSQIPFTEYAKNAQKTTFSLPDNSEVVLNSGSEIEYKKWNWNTQRHLNLKGEAFFKVAKGKTFEVQTSLGKVTVLGTQFNVKARKNRFEVSCFEGKVKVNYQNQEVIITKGKSVAFADGKAIEIPEKKSTQPEWMKNELVFSKESLTTILEELQRQYNVEFELKNQTSNQLFTGTIPMKNLDDALQILSVAYHLKSTKVSTEKIILETLNVQK